MFADGKPAPFSAFTTPEFWDDPHISAQMLTNHLNPTESGASRPHAFIDRSVEWLVPALGLTSGSTVLDLGCGPGLYAHRLAMRGIRVLGVDVSRRSLDYARSVAEAAGLPATFRHADYLTDDLGAGHHAAILIYEDYCALSPEQRAMLLRRTRSSLAPAGSLLFDVASAARFPSFTEMHLSARNLMDGFWSSEPYLGTHERWTYPDIRLVLDKYTIETHHSTRQFGNWMQCLTPTEVAQELSDAGFGSVTLFADVAGGEFDPSAETFAVIAAL